MPYRAAHAQGIRIFGDAAVGPRAPEGHLHPRAVDVVHDRLDPVREPGGIPPPVATRGEPHGVWHEGLESQVMRKAGHAQEVRRLRALGTAGIEVDGVIQRRVWVILGNAGTQFLDHKPVQRIAPLLDVAAVTAHERRRHQECFPGCNVGLEIRVQPHVQRERLRLLPGLCADATESGELPADVKPVAITHLDSQPGHRAGPVKAVIGQGEVQSGRDRFREGAALFGGVAGPPLDPPNPGRRTRSQRSQRQAVLM